MFISIERFIHSFIELSVGILYICTVDHHVIDRIFNNPNVISRNFSKVFFPLFSFQFDKRIIDKWQHPSWKYVRTKLITFRPAKPKSCSLSDIPDLEGNVAKRKDTDVVKGPRFSEKDWYYLQAQTDKPFHYLKLVV